MMMKTDNHFKLCLEREKRKNTELKGVVGRVQAKNEQIRALVEQALKRKSQKSGSSEREKQLERLIEEIKMKTILVSSPKKEIRMDSHEFSDILLL